MKIGGARFVGALFLALIFANACTPSSGSGGGGDGSGSEEGTPVGGVGDDVTSPGLPATKVGYTEALGLATVQGVADHYDFQDHPDDYRVLTETLHGTQVHVAVHDTVNVTDEIAQEWSANVRDCWHAAWHVFGGYRYDRFSVLVRSTGSDEEDFSLSEAGVSINAADLETDDYEFVCHELIHVWLGKLIAHEPDGTDNLFQTETWVSEGTVVYYSFRILADVIGESEYTSGMNGRFEDYEDARGGSLDKSIADLAEEIGRDFSHDGVGVLYARGALISYLLDSQMVELGFSLDDVSEHLYKNFGLTDKEWTQADLEEAVEDITGTSFANFFDTYLDTNVVLELEGSFEEPLKH